MSSADFARAPRLFGSFFKSKKRTSKPNRNKILERRRFFEQLEGRQLMAVTTAEPVLDAATFSGQEINSYTAASALAVADDFVAVDTAQGYQLSGWARAGTVTGGQFNANNLQYLGFNSYDADFNQIQPNHVQKVAGSTDTRLAAPLAPNDTILVLEDATGWSNQANSATRQLAWYGYRNASGELYPDYTYTRNVLTNAWNVGAITYDDPAHGGKDVIQLRVPWAGPSLPTGTAVRNAANLDSVANYPLRNTKVSNAWTSYSVQVSGAQDAALGEEEKFRAGTAYIKPVILANNHGLADNQITWRDLEWTYASLPLFQAENTIDLHTGVTSGYFDGDSSELTYTWTQISGPAVSLLDSNSPIASFEAPAKLLNHDFTFEVETSGSVDMGRTARFDSKEQWGQNGADIGTNRYRLGDFNGDGREDVLSIESNGVLYVWDAQNDADGGFSGPASRGTHDGTNTPDRYHVGDFNGDGRDDVIAFEDTTPFSYTVWTANTSGGFNAGTAWGSNGANIGASRYKIGDFNGDGRDDVVSFESNAGIYVWTAQNDADGGFTYAGRWAWAPNQQALDPSRFQLGDFNNDGRTDIMAVHTDKNLYVLTANTTSGFATAAVWGTNGADLGTARYKLGDVTGDGRDDLLSFETNGGIYVWTTQSDADGGFNTASRWAWGPGQLDIGGDRYRVADLDNDGRDDVTAFHTDGTFHVWRAKASSGFTAEETWASNSSFVTPDRYNLADVNNDSAPDVVSFESDAKFYVWTADEIVPADSVETVTVSVACNPSTAHIPPTLRDWDLTDEKIEDWFGENTEAELLDAAPQPLGFVYDAAIGCGDDGLGEGLMGGAPSTESESTTEPLDPSEENLVTSGDPQASVTVVDATATEPPLLQCVSQDWGHVRIELTDWNLSNVTVSVSGSATPDIDYEIVNSQGSRIGQFSQGEYSFSTPLGMTELDLFVKPLRDADETDDGETVEFSVDGGSGSATVTILDTLDEINLEANPGQTNEGGGAPGQFAIRATAGTLCADFRLVIDTNIENAATPTADYTLVRVDVTPSVTLQITEDSQLPGIFNATMPGGQTIHADGDVLIEVRPVTDSLDEQDEIVRASVATDFVGGTGTGTALTVRFDDVSDVVIKDNDGFESGELEANLSADNSCSCSCVVCPTPGATVSPATGSLKYSLPANGAALPEMQSEGAHGLHPTLHAKFQFPDQKEVPNQVKATLYVVRDGETDTEVTATYTYKVDPESGDQAFVAGDRFEFDLQADLTQIASSSEFESYDLRLEVLPVYTLSIEPERRVLGWKATTSHLVRNPNKSSIAPGWVFPFLKRLIPDETGVSLFRGDNTASRYHGGNTPPETLSTLALQTDGSYRLTHRYGDYDEFDSVGLQTKAVDRNGNATAFTYEDGHLKTITDSFNRTTTYDYSTPVVVGNVSTTTITATDFADRQTKFELVKNTQTNATALTVTYPEPEGSATAPVFKFAYQSDVLNSVTATDNTPGGTGPSRVTGIVYDVDDGRVSSIQSPDGATFAIVSDSQRDVLPSGTSEILRTSDGPGLRDAVASFIRTVEVEDGNSNKTTYKFDHRGRVNEIKDASGNTQVIDLLVERDPNSGSYLRDRGEILSINSPDPDDLAQDGRNPLVTTFDYDANGNVVFQSLPNQGESGLHYTWLYGVNNQPTKFTNELGHEVLYTLDDASGNVLSTTSKNPLTGDPTFPWQNPVLKYDVNNDGTIAPLDSLIVINDLNSVGSRQLSGTPNRYLDTNADGFVSSQDVLVIFNYLNDDPKSVAIGDASTSFSYTFDETSGIPNGLLETITVETNRSADLITSYSYFDVSTDEAEFGRLKTVTVAGTVVATYAYDDYGNLKSVTDALNSVYEYRYDALNRLVAEMGPDPDGAGSQRAPLTRYQYDVFGNQIAKEVQVNYDSTLDQSAAQVTCYAYDSQNRLTHIGEADALVSSLPGTDADTAERFRSNAPIACGWLDDPGDHPVTQYVYDDNGNVTSVTDAQGRVTSYEYDELNRLEKIIEPAPGTSYASELGEQLQGGRPVTRFTYDNLGNVWSVTDALGNETHYRYDDLGRLVTEVDVPFTLPQPDRAALLPGGNLTTLKGVLPIREYEYAPTLLGWRETMKWRENATDVEDNRVQTDRDFLRRVTATTESDLRVNRFEYFPDGLLKAVTDGERNRTEYIYNTRGLLQSVKSPDPDGATGPLLPSETQYVYDAADRVTSVTDPLNRVTSYAYDNLGRVQMVTMPDPDSAGTGQGSATIEYTYDRVGNLLSETDALNQSTTYGYDQLFRRTSTTDALGKVTHFTYDKVGNLTSLTDPNGNVTSWIYDPLNRVHTETQVDKDYAEPGGLPGKSNGARTYKYDAVGNLREVTDREGRVTKFEYDPFYRLTSEKWFDNASDQTANRDIQFDYDLAGQLETASEVNAATLSFTYDSLGRPELVTHQIAGLTSNVTFDAAYDLNGNRKKLAVNIGGTVNNDGILSGGKSDFVTDSDFDQLNRLIGITQYGVTNGNAVADKHVVFAYDAASQMQSISRYEAQSSDSTKRVGISTLGYDRAGRLNTLVHTKSELAPGAIDANGKLTPPTQTELDNNYLAGYTYTWDQANRLTNLTNLKFTGESVIYSYDTRGQLTGANYTSSSPSIPDELYSFDDNGNRTSANGETSTPDSFNQIQSDREYNYEYDKEGNRKKRTRIEDGEVTEYTWDHRNRLEKVKQGLAETTYTYDAFNRLVRRQHDPDGPSGAAAVSSTVFVNDGTQIAMEFEGNSPVPSHRYLWGAMVDQILADEQGATASTAGNVLWPLTDHLGTVRDIADRNETTGTTSVTNHRVYDSFGNRESESNSTLDHVFGFTGKYFDEATKLGNHWNRWYDPATGTWASQDPISFSGGDANLYRYVLNQTTSLTDPSGYAPPGSMRDILKDLRREGDAGMRRNLEDRDKVICDNKTNVGEEGQRMFADIGGFGSLVDGYEAASGKDAFNDRELSWWERGKSAMWGIVGVIPGFGSADDAGKRVARNASNVGELVEDGRTALKEGAQQIGTLRKTADDLVPNNAAHNAADYLRLKDKLSGEEIFEEALRGRGTPMIGSSTSRALRDAQRLADTYGGHPADWSKMGGASRTLSDGRKIEIHWYENLKTGVRCEYKTKIQ